MKCPIILKQELQEIIVELGLTKIKVNDYNYLKLAEQFGLIPKDTRFMDLKSYSNKEPK